MTNESSPLETAAGQLLIQMKRCGIDHILANAGTDFPSLIEVLSSANATDQLPLPMAIHHESVAMGMAHGYYLASGKVAAVAVHVNVGLANCAMGAINAATSQAPVFLMSGRTPVTEFGRHGSRVAPIHWGQEMFDQASVVRESVKWEYELRFPEQAATAVARAAAIAKSSPPGPVYLSLPRETLAEQVKVSLPEPVFAASSCGIPAVGLLEKGAEMLASARSPVIVLQRSVPGGNLPELKRFSEEFAIPVVEFWATASVMPTTHPMHAGFDPAQVVPDADLVLALGAPVPWAPVGAADPETKIIALGPDPLDQATPYRGFRCDLAMQADLGPGLEALSKSMLPKKSDMNLGERATKQASRREAFLRDIEQAISAGEAGPINHAFASRLLSEEAGPDAMVFSELGAVGPAMILHEPGQLYWTPHSGGLGWGVPAALGAKLAKPEKMSIAAVGDGSYLFANPAACHQVSVSHELPILTVVFNNGRWQAVKRAALGMYPDGLAAASNEMPLTQLGPSPDYSMIAAAHGAHAERVEDPAELRGAIRRALKVVREDRRQALLDLRVA